MLDKELKILAHLDKNARITTKKLGRKLHISQQSANYLLHKIENQPYFLNYRTYIDSAKFGLTKVIVFYNYTKFNQKRTILTHLKKIDSISAIEECSQGYDLMVEFTAYNLSSFNKENQHILHTFKDSLRQIEIFPVIVKHHYGRKYLGKLKYELDTITSGDRDVVKNTTRETLFLNSISEHARSPILKIAKNMNCDTKTAIMIKKRLESRYIIKKYGISINTPTMDINRIHVFISINREDISEIDTILEFIKKEGNVISAQKIIGEYELFLTIEYKNPKNKILNTIRERFNIDKYKLIVSENIVKEIDTPNTYFDQT